MPTCLKHKRVLAVIAEVTRSKVVGT